MRHVFDIFVPFTTVFPSLGYQRSGNYELRVSFRFLDGIYTLYISGYDPSSYRRHTSCSRIIDLFRTLFLTDPWLYSPKGSESALSFYTVEKTYENILFFIVVKIFYGTRLGIRRREKERKRERQRSGCWDKLRVFVFFQQPHFLSLALYRSISHCFCGLSPFSRRFFVQLGDLCKLAAPETSEPFIPRLRLSSVDARQPA